jgi:hypothetical protein|tara:strand:- start:1086 stop:1472 length:387 start_codon:yes stop_codon:yes gene_type:complete
MSDNKQMTIQEQKDRVRFELINNIFAALGLSSTWVHLDRIVEGLQYVLENKQLIENILPMNTVKAQADSNMWGILENEDDIVNASKSLLAFARRLARYRHFAVVNRRKSVRLNRTQTKTESYYRLLTQ